MNDWWNNIAVAGHRRGGLRGNVQAAVATGMTTLVEYVGINQADKGLDMAFDGRPLAGAALVGLAIVGNLPGGKALSKADDVVEVAADAVQAIGVGADAASSAVPQVLRNQRVGNAARDAIADARPGSLTEQNFRVAGGLRRVDVLDGATAIESKVGRTSLTAAVRQELARDVKLLRSGQVDAVQWHFGVSPTTGLGGPTSTLRAKLEKFGIKIVE